jgi:hypothetical protein
LRTVILFTVLSTRLIFGQGDYQSSISRKINEIKKLAYYENSIVLFDYKECYGYSIGCWNREVDYKEGDIVITRSSATYSAQLNNKGKDPTSSQREWKLLYGPHPYLFLRDSATLDDLKSLLVSDHIYVRTYAFGALSYRKLGLFEIIVDNLKDTTLINQTTQDSRYEVYPADLMIQYQVGTLSKKQKAILKDLILTKYKHLSRVLYKLKE